MQTKNTSIILPFLLLAFAVYVHRNSKREHLFGLGGKAKQETNTKVSFEDIREKITEISNSNKVNIDQSAFNKNELSFKANNLGPGCTIDLEQKISSSQMTVVNITNDVAKEMEEEVTKQLDQKAEAVTGQKTDVVGSLSSVLGGGTDQTTNTTIETSIKDITKDVFNTENLTAIKQSVINQNKGGIKIKNCKGGTLNLHQDIINDQVSEAIFENLTESITNSKIGTIFSQAGTATTTQEDTTVSSVTGMISGIFQGAFMTYIAAFCASGCVCCGCVLVMGMLMMSGQGDQVVAGIGAVGNAASRTMAAKYGA